MAQTDYRVLVHTIATGVLVAEVRPTAAKWTEALNGKGTAQVTTPTATLRAALDPITSRPATCALTIVAPDGSVRYSGPVWSADIDLDGNTSLTSAGPLSILTRRMVRSTLTYTGVDQAAIAAGLVAHAQDTSGGRTDRALGISTASVGTTGVTRTLTYTAPQKVGDALTRLADMDQGFTFAFTPLLGAGRSLTYRLDVTHPNSGVATTTVLVHRSNCLVTKVAVDGSGVATDVWAVGGGRDAALVQQRGGATAGLPCLEVVQTWNDLTTATALQRAGDRLLALGGSPRVQPTVQVFDSTNPAPLDSLPRLVVPELGLDGRYRVLAVDTTLVGNEAVSTLTLATASLYAEEVATP